MSDTTRMRNEFTAIFEQDGEWVIAYCPEIPGANGQGRTRDEARQNLMDAIVLILEDRREDSLRGLPPNADKKLSLLQHETRDAAETSATPRLLVEARRCVSLPLD